MLKRKGLTAHSEHRTFRVRDNAVCRGFSGMRSHLDVLLSPPHAEHDQIGSHSSRCCDDYFTGLSICEERFGPAPELRILGDQFMEIAQ